MNVICNMLIRWNSPIPDVEKLSTEDSISVCVLSHTEIVAGSPSLPPPSACLPRYAWSR